MVATARVSRLAVLACITSASAFSLFDRQTTMVISSSGSCGILDGIATTCLGSAQGNCCSRLGYCGANSSYCGAGCQTTYGQCGDPKISTDGTCGPANGLTCLGAAMGNCCSQNGYCGDTSGHCGTGCQSQYGDCYNGGGNVTVGTASGTANATVASSTASQATSSVTAINAATSASTTVLSAAREGGASVTETAGFKAGMAVMAIAIAGGVLAIAFFIWKRRQHQKAHAAFLAEHGHGHDNDNVYEGERKEMPSNTSSEPHELNGQRQHELLGSKPEPTIVEKPTPAYELHADEHKPDNE